MTDYPIERYRIILRHDMVAGEETYEIKSRLLLSIAYQDRFRITVRLLSTK